MTGAIPTFRYRDPEKAIEFLVEAFGFDRHLVAMDDGEVVHAQLTLGDGMVMLGAVGDDEYGRLFSAVEDGTPPTSSAYVVVDDPYAHAERARAAGAEIVMEPTEQDYGGANYVARDPAGFVWSFGSYDPWAE